MSLGDARPFRVGCAPAPSPSAAEKDRAQIRVTCVTVPWPPSSKVLKSSTMGEALLDRSGDWMPELRDAVSEAMTALAEDVVESINFFVDSEQEEQGEVFDPKVVFKSREGVRELENFVQRDSRRQARRDPGYLFNVDPKHVT
jgi:hypothetical protein